jgi:hypothetical protein
MRHLFIIFTYFLAPVLYAQGAGEVQAHYSRAVADSGKAVSGSVGVGYGFRGIAAPFGLSLGVDASQSSWEVSVDGTVGVSDKYFAPYIGVEAGLTEYRTCRPSSAMFGGVVLSNHLILEARYEYVQGIGTDHVLRVGYNFSVR